MAIDYDNQEIHEIFVGSLGPIYVCDTCMQGIHKTYGWDHVETGTGCKNVGKVGEKTIQCQCHAEWPELLAEIRSLRKKSIARVVARFRKKTQDVVGEQEVEVWAIEEEGGEESERKVPWTIYYDATGDTFQIINVLDATGNEVDYIDQGYTSADLARLVETTQKEEESDKEGVVKRVQDHHRTIIERGDLSLAKIERVARHYRESISKYDILKVVDQIYDFLNEAGVSDILRSDLIATSYKWFRPSTLKRIIDAISESKVDTVLSLVHK